jgi:hypothetical protein
MKKATDQSDVTASWRRWACTDLIWTWMLSAVVLPEATESSLALLTERASMPTTSSELHWNIPAHYKLLHTPQHGGNLYGIAHGNERRQDEK